MHPRAPCGPMPHAAPCPCPCTAGVRGFPPTSHQTRPAGSWQQISTWHYGIMLYNHAALLRIAATQLPAVTPRARAQFYKSRCALHAAPLPHIHIRGYAPVIDCPLKYRELRGGRDRGPCALRNSAPRARCINQPLLCLSTVNSPPSL
jgi:hypothetical protein